MTDREFLYMLLGSISTSTTIDAEVKRSLLDGIQTQLREGAPAKPPPVHIGHATPGSR